jgi:hypothetical protein
MAPRGSDVFDHTTFSARLSLQAIATIAYPDTIHRARGIVKHQYYGGSRTYLKITPPSWYIEKDGPLPLLSIAIITFGVFEYNRARVPRGSPWMEGKRQM